LLELLRRLLVLWRLIEVVAATVVVVGSVADCNAAAVGNFVDMVAAAADNTAGVVVGVDIAGTTVVEDGEDPTRVRTNIWGRNGSKNLREL
jgi:hypothetical protein